MQTLYPALAAVAAYLIGSLSFAVIVSRLMGLNDPRTYGSGNPGATNVLRSGNKAAAVLTLLLDALKGFVPVLLVRLYGAPFGLDEGTLALVALAAFLGHLWPVFFHFKGGKGVATAAGVLFGLNPWLGLATLATWIIIAVFSRYSSLAALVAAVFAPFYQVLIWGGGPVAVAVFAMGALLVWRHSANIQKLLAGTESKLGQKAGGAVAPRHATGHSHDHAHGRQHKHSHKHGAKP
jgi:glycerol-3-phosphate acyltransferase PlsY